MDQSQALTLPYFYAAPTQRARRGVVLCHEGMGMTMQLIRFARRLAGQGYLVLAPDFFFRTGGPQDDDHWMHINAVTEAQLAGDLEAAIAVLRAEGATSIGVTGFCMGGRFSYRAAKWAQRLGVSAAVGFYGDIAKELSNPRCPTLLLFGGRDEWIPADDIAAACTHHGEAVVVYPDANHGFMRDGTRFYDEAAAADAWARLLAFFDRHLD